jgi:Clostripain family
MKKIANRVMNVIFILILVISTPFILPNNLNTYLDVEKRNKDSWTILIYAVVETQLESIFNADLIEIFSINPEDGFNVIVQYDNSSKHNYRVIVKHDQSEFLKNKGLENLIFEQNQGYIDTLPDSHSSSPDTLKNFINWSRNKFPAKNYGLIFWGHGNQWRGFGGDPDVLENTGKIEAMSLKAIRDGVLYTDIANFKKWDFLIFDTCLMGGVEPLIYFSDLAQIFIANSDIDAGNGLDFENTFRYLMDNPSISIFDFAKKEVKFWEIHHNFSKYEPRNAHAAYSLEYIGQFKIEVAEFFRLLLENWGDYKDTFIDATKKVIRYGFSEEEYANTVTAGGIYNTYSFENLRNEFVDFFNLLIILKTNMRVNALNSVIDDVIKTIEKIVFVKHLGNYRKDGYALSIWLPVYNIKFFLNSYINSNEELLKPWAEVVAAIEDAQIGKN